MASPEIFVLDVGHGNCAVLSDTAGVAVIDCAPGVTLTQLLEQLGTNDISIVLISHADEDHVGGLIALLQKPEITVHNVYINPDALKETEIWHDVRYALRDARRTKDTKVNTSLTSELTGSLDNGEVHVEVIGPSPELVLGGDDLNGRRLTSNSKSAVIRLVYKGHPFMLAAGDVDWVGFQNLVNEGRDIRADILIFPHHGGKSGGAEPKDFAFEVCSRVEPSSVIFSIARTRSGFPRPDTIEGVRVVAPQAHIACTQLSRDCATDTPTSFEHLLDYPAKGRDKNSCCAGTMHIDLGREKSYEDFKEAHAAFVTSLAPTMCQRLSVKR